MAKTKKLKYKQADGTLSDYVAIGADASNVDLEEGISLEELNIKLVRNNNSTLSDADGNTINPKTKVENITDKNDVALSVLLNNNIIQYTTMPEANDINVNKIIQYIGTSTEVFTQGYFYKCVQTNSTTYQWQPIDVQQIQSLTFDSTPTTGSTNPVTSEGVKTYVDNSVKNIDLSKYYTKTETDNLLKNINVDLSNYYTKTEIDTIIGDIETLLAAL